MRSFADSNKCNMSLNFRSICRITLELQQLKSLQGHQKPVLHKLTSGTLIIGPVRYINKNAPGAVLNH